MTARLPKILTKRKLLISAALVAFVSVLSILVVGWSKDLNDPHTAVWGIFKS